METTPPTPLALLVIFLKIGVSSFGGGTTTLALMQRDIVERHHWLTSEQFALAFGLSTITPGINILGQTVVIGRMLAGWTGITCAVVGLLAPAAALTTALSAAYVAAQHIPVVTAAMRGIIPATIGLTVAVAAGMWPRPPIRRPGDRPREFGIVVGAFVLLYVLHVQVPIALALGGVAGGIFWSRIPPQSATTSASLTSPVVSGDAIDGR